MQRRLSAHNWRRWFGCWAALRSLHDCVPAGAVGCESWGGSGAVTPLTKDCPQVVLLAEAEGCEASLSASGVSISLWAWLCGVEPQWTAALFNTSCVCATWGHSSTWVPILQITGQELPFKSHCCQPIGPTNPTLEELPPSHGCEECSTGRPCCWCMAATHTRPQAGRSQARTRCRWRQALFAQRKGPNATGRNQPFPGFSEGYYKQSGVKGKVYKMSWQCLLNESPCVILAKSLFIST